MFRPREIMEDFSEDVTVETSRVITVHQENLNMRRGKGFSRENSTGAGTEAYSLWCLV